MSGVIAVHCGAGTYNSTFYPKYKKLSKKASLKGMEIIKDGGTALEAIKTAIKVLEDSPLTNCGYGSNLTTEGTVECDASIMDGKNLNFGGCGAVKKIKNPIELAEMICLNQSEVSEYGLVPPSILVGKGALKYAKSNRIKVVREEELVSDKALRQFKKYRNLVGEKFDTVGAVCRDLHGNVASGCSSGGILLKKPGRLGQAAHYASGVWADSFDKNRTAVAVCTSGCGEYLIKTQLAKVVAEDVVRSSECPTVAVSNSITDNFLNSRYLVNVSSKMCGALVLCFDGGNSESSVLWGHTTETMSIGVMWSSEDKPKGLISELPDGVVPGTKVNVSGIYKYDKI